MAKSVSGTSADPVIEFVKLELDGEVYDLVYDFNAIAEAEKLGECNLLHGIAAVMFNSMTAAQLRGLFYAALHKAHPKMTLAQAGALIRVDTMTDIREALLEAYGISVREPKKTQDPPGGGASPPVS